MLDSLSQTVASFFGYDPLATKKGQAQFLGLHYGEKDAIVIGDEG